MTVFRDRVKDTTDSIGTGDITLSGSAPISFQSFGSAFSTTDTFDYCIADSVSGLWETGVGHLFSPTVMIRDIVHDGSSGLGAWVAFTAGTKNVFCTVTAAYIQSLLPAISGTAQLDFGTGSKTAEVVVTGVSATLTTSRVMATMRVEATASHSVDDMQIDPIRVLVKSLVTGDGFTIYGEMDNAQANGLFKVDWFLSN